MSGLSEKARALADRGPLDAQEDRAFIAEARTLVPALCDENDELRGELNIAVERGNGWRTMVREDTEKAGEQAARIRELEEVLGHIAARDELVEVSDGAWALSAYRRCQEQAQWALARSDTPTDHKEGT